MKFIREQCIERFIRVCSDGWRMGWHERNGGNVSYRMTDEERAACKRRFKTGRPWTALAVQSEYLRGEYFIVTGSGKFFRTVPLSPEEHIGIIELNDEGNAYRVVWGLTNDARPTSELPAHLLCHSVRSRITKGIDRALYHAHPSAVIALTRANTLTARAISRALWQSLTESILALPEGAGVLPAIPPGSLALAEATSAQMEQYSAVIWAFHGALCAGTDLDDAFGRMHTIEKAADIHLRAHPPRQTVSDGEIRAIAKGFGVTINEAFLD